MKKKIIAIIVNVELIIMSCIVLVPVIWILLSTFQANGVAGKLSVSKLTLINFKKLLSETNYELWFFNTLKIALISTVCSVFLIMVTAWVMSRFNFKGRKTSLLAMMILSMFPTFLSMTAIHTLFQTIGLMGKPISLIVVYSVGAIPYNTWLVKGYLDGIPKSIDEAAYIDGCTKIQTFRKIVLPLSKPIITYCAVSQFMLPWMDYILPNILLSNDKSKTLAVGLFAFIQGRESTYFGMFAAGALLIVIPITLVFIIFQKYLVQGVAAGADKG
ncbi:sugar ABC transporter permease [Anaerosacchariphilus polymeriproducens]|uniref:Sugar ABC transporter permease n=1 Tax=Anaerosacchariphilus polymeriproducens TaxID=1812858 RepID=A0A371AXG4_9FIRM|nr:sugar ABC transporter permease [Anaerosacchariphilus polymeriproducens]RDU24170.1 sugar ABC transporter permease [Anaerosacchariphilus polymeriproducens]